IAAAKTGYRETREFHAPLDRADTVLVLEEAGLLSLRVVEKGTSAPVPRFTVKTALAENAFRKTKKSSALSNRFPDEGIQGRDGSLRIDSDLAPGVFFKVLVEAEGLAERVVDEVEAWS